MIEVNKNSTRTDVAWKRLYSRLNQDNLLPATGEETIHRRLFLKWGRVAAAVFIGSAWHRFCGLHRETGIPA